MAKRRLTMAMREKLINHVGRNLDPAGERRALDAAYAAAMPLVRGVVERRYPAREMRVLDKYQVAQSDQCVKLQLADLDVTQFTFQPDDAPLVPEVQSCEQRMYQADAPASEAVRAWLAASEAYERVKKARRAAYRAVVYNATHVEEVVELWPEAAALLPPVTDLVLALRPEDLELVRADLRERVAEVSA